MYGPMFFRSYFYYTPKPLKSNPFLLNKVFIQKEIKLSYTKIKFWKKKKSYLK